MRLPDLSSVMRLRRWLSFRGSSAGPVWFFLVLECSSLASWESTLGYIGSLRIAVSRVRAGLSAPLRSSSHSVVGSCPSAAPPMTRRILIRHSEALSGRTLHGY